MEEKMVVNSITGALRSLTVNVDNSSLTDNEKLLLRTLLEKLFTYYVTKINSQKYCGMFECKEYKDAQLTSEMIRYIVTINDTLLGKYDIINVTNVIQKEIGVNQIKRKKTK